MDEELYGCLKYFSEEYSDLHPSEIPVIDNPPTPLEFYRKWVSPNIPVIIKNAIGHWPALTNWNHEYLRSKLEGLNITVAVTPNGYADAVYENKFVLPEERLLPFDTFLKQIENTHPLEVFYVQKQNNNLNEEFKHLINDVDDHIPWATEAFGNKPDAVNFWMGDQRAVTSLHKDHYENIYCVIKGRKEFILHAPVDAAWIPYENYQVGTFCFDKDVCCVLDSENEVKWTPIDPLKPNYDKYPMYKNAKQYHCILEEGDVLYLPALWFHHVRQSHACIAVNYWYDMNFDIKYCYFKCLEKFGELINKTNLTERQKVSRVKNSL